MAPMPAGQIDVARQIKQIFQQTPGVVDVDWYVEDPQPEYRIEVDEEKAALHGISAVRCDQHNDDCAEWHRGRALHSQTSREDIPITVRMTRADRSSLDALESTKLTAADGSLVSLRELTRSVADARTQHLPQEHEARSCM